MMSLDGAALRLWESTDAGRTAVTLTPFLPPPQHASGAAMIICPGGGYVVLAPHEGEPVARWLAGHGIAAFVLHYRLAPQHRHPAMLQDAARAVRSVRHNAARWQIDPARVGVLGFSAGGHLASLLMTHHDAGDPHAADPLERISARPNLVVLIYPVITLQEPHGHAWCRECLLGQHPDPADVAALSSHTQVAADTPPAFLVQTADDSIGCMHSLLMAQALGAAGVPFELHLYERGGHGYGLAEDVPLLGTWPSLCIAWLQQHGFGAAQA